MLSIAKLAAAGQRYYLDQAKDRTSHERSVASGVEDYYLDGPEPEGRWLGTGAVRRGLEGERVSEHGLHAALTWSDPRTGAPFEGPVRHARVPGFDLMFSVPKSASVLFGIGGPAARGAVLAAQRTAVAAGIAYLERSAAATRMGHAGAHRVQAEGLLGAAFEHRTSRAGDPQLHTHVLVANAVERPDGLFGALDGRGLYAHARAAGHVHEAVFRHELTRELGVAWTQPRNGTADIDGVSVEVLAAFSRRSREIDEQVAAWGADSAAARQSAAVQTRKAKDYRVSPADLVPEWRTRAAALGLAEEHLAALTGRTTVRSRDPDEQDRLTARLLGPEGLTGHAAHFEERDVVCATANALSTGASLTELTALVARTLRDSETVELGVEAPRRQAHVLRLKDGSVVPSAAAIRYSTRRMLRAERFVLDQARERDAESCCVVEPEAVTAALASRPSISREQAAMVRRLTTSGAGVEVVVGRAGSGKTFALDAAREAWEAEGFRVFGAAVARSAACNLQDSTGIASTSVASLLNDLRRGGGFGLGPRTAVIVDEAGMLGTHQLAELLKRAAKARAKVVLVGDHKQLPEIDAGGSFRMLVDRLQPAELVENRRQVEPADRDKVGLLRSGQAAAALTIARDRGDVIIAANAPAVRERLVDDYFAARANGAAGFMIALRRSEVDDLNRLARSRLLESGVLKDVPLRVGTREFSIGDEVVLKLNDRRLGAVNGQQGRVAAVDLARESITVEDGTGRIRRLDAAYLHTRTRTGEATLLHGYALTAHAAQGLTTDETFVLGSDAVYKEWGYVAFTRARHRTRFYICDPIAQLPLVPGEPVPSPPEALLSKTRAQLAAHDVADVEQLDRLATRDLQREERRLTKRFGDPKLGRPRHGTEEHEPAGAAERSSRRPRPTAPSPSRRFSRLRSWLDSGSDGAALDRSQRELDGGIVDGGAPVEDWPSGPDPLTTRARLKHVRALLATRERRTVATVRYAEPPAHVLARLGPPPEGLARRPAWEHAARLEHDRHPTEPAARKQATGPSDPREPYAEGAPEAERETALPRRRQRTSEVARRGRAG